jgi:hypothetical protein
MLYGQKHSDHQGGAYEVRHVYDDRDRRSFSATHTVRLFLGLQAEDRGLCSAADRKICFAAGFCIATDPELGFATDGGHGFTAARRSFGAAKRFAAK